VEVRANSPRSFDVPKVVLNISKAHRLLNWEPQVDMRTGLERTWKWIHQAVSMSDE
jgi:UDP-glucose 4-epimerase